MVEGKPDPVLWDEYQHAAAETRQRQSHGPVAEKMSAGTHTPSVAGAGVFRGGKCECVRRAVCVCSEYAPGQVSECQERVVGCVPWVLVTDATSSSQLSVLEPVMHFE